MMGRILVGVMTAAGTIVPAHAQVLPDPPTSGSPVASEASEESAALAPSGDAPPRGDAPAADAAPVSDAAATLPYAPGQAGVQLAPPAPRSVMDKRWAIGIDVGPETYRADVSGAEPVEFGQLELAGRYRVRRAIELGLAVHLGGSNRIGMGGLYLDFRYRFMAEQKLNVYALASLGALAIAHEDATADEKRGRGSLRLGGGIEYRWNWFALIFELRLVSVGENKELESMPAETVGYQLARAPLGGISIAMGANFYF
jgi:hypothetical protein